tara:strand:+ start:1626 stop:2201 length:576 start_codon:yes stop_codon:yes gene_type:complete
MNKRVKNPDFQKSKIYKITCEETGLLYIGATTMPLSYRLQHHLSPYNPCTSRKMKSPQMELLFEYPCECKRELDLKEAEVIKAHKLLLKEKCVNVKIPLRTQQEYLIENAELVTQKRKIYYAKNADILKQKAKNFYSGGRAKDLKIKRLINLISVEILKENPREKWLLKWNKRLLALRNNENDKKFSVVGA